jgi:murein DD-endopeptidase MepM/ murein hydrolase activator NlpD
MVATSRRSRKKSSTLAPAPARRGNVGLFAVIGALVLVNLYVFVWRDGTSLGDVKKTAENASIPGGSLDGSGAAPGDPAAGSGSGEVSAADEGPAEPAPNAILGTVGKTDSLGKILKREGLAPAESDELLRALAPVLDFKKLREGQAYTIVRGPDGRVDEFELVVSKLQTVRAVRDPAGALVGVADKAQTRIEAIEAGGVIDSSLYAAVKASGEDTALVAFFVDVFAYDLDFYNDTHDGDEFRIVVEKEYKDQEFLRYGRILAAEYKGKAGTFRAFWWQAPGAARGRYYDGKGQSLERSLLKTPLKYTRISSKFDRKRMHPVLHTTRAHLGVDYAAPTGTPVWAAASGRIVSRGPAGGAGNMVVISHDGGLATVYMHLSKFAAGQKVGQRVEAKTVIGYVGTTGLSTGPHLHFGVKKDGSYVDPSKLVPVRAGGVAKKDATQFRADIDAMIARLAAIDMTPKAPAVDPDPTAAAPDPASAGAATGAATP